MIHMKHVLFGVVLVYALLTSPGLFAKSQLQLRAEAAIRERLVDPDSLSIKVGLEMKDSICGKWNAKNRMGGYNGFHGFIYGEKDGVGTLMLEDPTIDTSKGLTQAVVESMFAAKLCDEMIRDKAKK